MKPLHPHVLKGTFGGLCGLSLLLPLTATPAFAATVLSMDSMPHNIAIPVGFASFATTNGTGFTVSAGLDGIVGTPNIDLGWLGTGHRLDSYQNWDGRGTVLQTDYLNSSTSNILDIPFTPNSASFGVFISSFELDEYTGGSTAAVNWSVLNGATTIVSGSWTRSTGGRDVINTGMTLAQAQANAGAALTLRFERVSGTSSYLAVDNLAFDQVNAVPEPTTTTLAVLGLGALAMRRRRKIS